MILSSFAATITGVRIGGAMVHPLTFMMSWSAPDLFLRTSLTIRLTLPSPVQESHPDAPPSLITVMHVAPRPG